MAFIFMQSALPVDISSKESDIFAVFLARYLNADPELMSRIIRKTAHFLEYLILGFSLYLTVDGYRQTGREVTGRDTWAKQMILPWTIGTFYAMTDEFHQRFVPGRSCQATDVLIDACGVACGVTLARLIRRRRQSK